MQREEFCVAAFLIAYILARKVSRWMRRAGCASVDEVRVGWPRQPSCYLLQLVRMCFDHRVYVLDYEKCRKKGVRYNAGQRLPDQTSILRGVVDLHLHDTRKPFPNEQVARPHERPVDPYWEETLAAYALVRNKAQAAFVLVMATMTGSRVAMPVLPISWDRRRM